MGVYRHRIVTILSDQDIKHAIRSGEIFIRPGDPLRLQPASVDLTLGTKFLVFSPHSNVCIDPTIQQNLVEEVEVEPGESFVMHPGQFVLAATAERIRLARTIVGRVDGKSSLGRLGLLIHSTAGFIDPGFEGTLTLELSSVAPLPTLLRPGMAVCQVSFSRMASPALVPYGSASLGSKYQGQTDPEASQFWKNKRNDA